MPSLIVVTEPGPPSLSEADDAHIGEYGTQYLFIDRNIVAFESKESGYVWYDQFPQHTSIEGDSRGRTCLTSVQFWKEVIKWKVTR